MSSPVSHTFKTTLSTERLKALIGQACKATAVVELEAHDRGCIPNYRLYCVTFANPEDRDRARIAMRFLEKEQKEATRDTKPAAAMAVG